MHAKISKLFDKHIIRAHVKKQSYFLEIRKTLIKFNKIIKTPIVVNDLISKKAENP